MITVALNHRQLLSLESSFRAGGIERAQSNARDLSAGTICRHDRSPGQVSHLRVWVYARRREKRFEVAHLLGKHLVLHLREPGKLSGGLQISIGKLVGGFRKHSDDSGAD